MATEKDNAGTTDVETAADADITRDLSAQNLIKSYVIASIGAGTVPLPLFDIAAVVAIQLRMIQKLSQLYGKRYSERAARNTITGLLGGTLGYGAGYIVGFSAAKLIPAVGWMIGVASVPLFAGGSTYAVGRTLVHHFEEGGSLFDMNTSKLRAYYREQFQKGKDIAAEMKDDLTGAEKPAAA